MLTEAEEVRIKKILAGDLIALVLDVRLLYQAYLYEKGRAAQAEERMEEWKQAACTKPLTPPLVEE